SISGAGGTMFLGTKTPVDLKISSRKFRITSSSSASEMTGKPSWKRCSSYFV
ncbi:hypothetical protein A2U01_0095300, partial [Trifolium medium]|nr:hypothetical protein [Trifolium medium]